MSELAGCDVILFCTKSGDTEDAARELEGVLSKPVTVISLQNGVGNVDLLTSSLPGHEIVAGTVPFNVVRMSPNAVHCAMTGRVLIGPGAASQRLVAGRCRARHSPSRSVMISMPCSGASSCSISTMG